MFISKAYVVGERDLRNVGDGKTTWNGCPTRSERQSARARESQRIIINKCLARGVGDGDDDLESDGATWVRSGLAAVVRLNVSPKMIVNESQSRHCGTISPRRRPGG